jgi:hypothetical protein
MRSLRLGTLPARIEFRPGEWCLGVRVERMGLLVDVWVGLLPMIPVHIWFLRKWKGDTSVEAAGGHHVYPDPREVHDRA